MAWLFPVGSRWTCTDPPLDGPWARRGWGV